MSYYIRSRGGSANFKLQNAKGQTLAKAGAQGERLRTSDAETSTTGIPAWISILRDHQVDGMTEIVEHRKLEPIFCITDDPAVWERLGVGSSR
jgi:hypothetical protein